MSDARRWPPATDLLFLYSYNYLPGLCHYETLDYYAPWAAERLRTDTLDLIEHYLDLWSNSSEYGHYFYMDGNDYAQDDDTFEDVERAVFRSALSADSKSLPIADLSPPDTLRGNKALMRHRIQRGDVHGAIQLFRDLFEHSYVTSDRDNPLCYITLCNAAEAGRMLITDISDAIVAHQKSDDSYRATIGRHMAPLQPLVLFLKTVVDSKTFPATDIDLGMLLLIVDYYKELLDKEGSSG